MSPSGDGFVSIRTTRNVRELVTLDIVGERRNGKVFDFVHDMDEDIQIEANKCPPCLGLLDNLDRENGGGTFKSITTTTTTTTNTTDFWWANEIIEIT